MLNSDAGTSLPKVTVKWEKGVAVGSSQSGSTIVIAGINDPDHYDPDIILHEYGHFVMHSTAGSPPGSGGEHTYTAPSSLATAYSEGWAHYFSCAVRYVNEIKDSNGTPANFWYGGNLAAGAYIDSNGTFQVIGKVSNDYMENGEYELHTAAAMQDLFDNNNDSWDVGIDDITRDFGHIDKTMCDYNTSIYDFYNNWITNGYQYSDKENTWIIFEQKGCSHDVFTPSVTLYDEQIAPGLFEGDIIEDLITKEIEWLIDGIVADTYVNPDTDPWVLYNVNASNLSDGWHYLSLREYDLEGLFTGNNRPRDNDHKYGVDTVVFYVENGVVTEPSKLIQTLDDTAGKTVELAKYKEDLFASIPNDETIFVKDGGSFKTENNIIYDFEIEENADVNIYAHLLSPIEDLNVYEPDGKLYLSKEMVFKDTPLRLSDLKPGKWRLEIVPYEKMKITSDQLSAIIAITAQTSNKDFSLPQITNSKKLVVRDKSLTSYQKALITVNGKVPEEYSSFDINQGQELILNEGNNTISVITCGIYGKSKEKIYKIKVDTMAPVIDFIEYKTDTVHTKNERFILNCSFSYDTVKAWINSEDIENLGDFSKGYGDALYLSKGSNIFEMKAMDAAGNESTKTLTVIFE